MVDPLNANHVYKGIINALEKGAVFTEFLQHDGKVKHKAIVPNLSIEADMNEADPTLFGTIMATGVPHGLFNTLSSLIEVITKVDIWS